MSDEAAYAWLFGPHLLAAALILFATRRCERGSAKRRRVVLAAIAVEAVAIIVSPLIFVYVPWMIYAFVRELCASDANAADLPRATRIHTAIVMAVGIALAMWGWGAPAYVILLD